MHVYWRINQDLEALGERIVFHDPSFIRCFKQWFIKNLSSLTRMEEDGLKKAIGPSMN